MSGGMRSREAVRPSPVGHLRTAVAAALVAGLLSLQVMGTVWLAIGYLVVVVALVTAWALVLDPPGRAGISGIGFVVAVLISLLSLATEGAATILLVGAVVALVAAMVLQIMRRPPRPGVVASLSSAATLGMVVVAGATLIGLREHDAGREITQLFIGVAAATVLVGRLVDAGLPRPVLRAGTGLPGVVLGVAAGLGTAALYSSTLDEVTSGEAMAVGAGATVATALFAVVAAVVTADYPSRYSDAVFGAAVPFMAGAPGAVLVFAAVVGG